MIRKRPYSNYYKKKKYFLGGSIATVSTGSGAAVGSQVGMLGGPVGMMLGSLAGQGIGALASKLFKKKEPPPPPLNPFQGNTASSYGNFAMGGYAPLGPDSVKYIGPKHKDGGILIDEDGMPTDNEQEAIAEVEGGETRDDNYIFSDELKYPGTDLTFAEVHETMVETGASEQDIEELKAIQEEVRESTGIAAKERAGMQMRNGSEIPKKDPLITQGLYTAPSERSSYNWAAQQQRIAEEELRKKEIEERRARIQDSLDVRDPQSDSYIPLTGEGSNLTERMARETQALGDKLRVSEEPNFFDDYINPLAFLGELTSGVGSVPKNVREGNYGAAAFGIGAPLVTGALAGIGSRSLGQFANNLANPLAGARSSVKNLFNPKFTSEIDWRNWLKYKEDFDNNPKVIQELLDIEKQSKANGTWMKNADGSPFQGTPEQFVVQQSSNFKKAFSEWEKMYHGSKTDNLRDFDLSKSERKAFGDGFYTTDSLEEAQKYAGFFKRTPNTAGKVYELAVNTKGGKKFSFKDREFLSKWNNSDLKNKTEYINEYKLKYGEEIPSHYLKEVEKYIPFKEDVPYGMEDLHKFPIILDGGYQHKWILSKTNPKSLVGNILFDMTNPNIYKSVLPVFGAASASQMKEQKYGGKLKMYEDGGYTPDPTKNLQKRLNEIVSPEEKEIRSQRANDLYSPIIARIEEANADSINDNSIYNMKKLRQLQTGNVYSYLTGYSKRHQMLFDDYMLRNPIPQDSYIAKELQKIVSNLSDEQVRNLMSRDYSKKGIVNNISALRDAGIPLISLPKYIMALNKANKKGYTMQGGGYIQNNLIN